MDLANINFLPLIEMENNPIAKMEDHLAGIALSKWEKAIKRLEDGLPHGLWASSSHWALLCPRRITYQLMGLFEVNDWRSQAVFRTGDMEEAALYGDLVGSGVEVRGTQLKLVFPILSANAVTIYVTGKLDGIIRICPDTQAVLEYKTGTKYEIDKWMYRNDRKGNRRSPEPNPGAVCQANMGIHLLNHGYLVRSRQRAPETPEEYKAVSNGAVLLEELPHEENCTGEKALTRLISDGTIDGPLDTACLIGLAKESQVRRGLAFEYQANLARECYRGFESAFWAWKSGKNTLPRGFQPEQKTKTTDPELPKSPNGGCAFCPSRAWCWENAGMYTPTKEERLIRIQRPDAPIPEAE